MLSREKQLPSTFVVNRNNTMALTYDMQNTSTKMILLNFSNRDDNRLRGHETIKENTILPKSFRSCYCMTESSPACACHHRDKNLSLSPRRHKTCHGDLTSPGNVVRLSPIKKIDKPFYSDKLPPCSSSNEDSVKTKKKRKDISPNKHKRINNRDLEIFYSIPSLSHPDFTAGQRRVLLSLAKIYTNLTPIKTYNNDFIKREYSYHTKESKENMEKKHSGTSKIKKKKKDNILRRDSLQTAVKTFGNRDQDLINNEKRNDRNRELKSFSPDLDELLESWLMNIILDQAEILKQQRVNNNNIKVYENNDVVLESPSAYTDSEDKITLQDTQYIKMESTYKNNNAMPENENCILNINNTSIDEGNIEDTKYDDDPDDFFSEVNVVVSPEYEEVVIKSDANCIYSENINNEDEVIVNDKLVINETQNTWDNNIENKLIEDKEIIENEYIKVNESENNIIIKHESIDDNEIVENEFINNNDAENEHGNNDIKQNEFVDDQELLEFESMNNIEDKNEETGNEIKNEEEHKNNRDIYTKIDGEKKSDNIENEDELNNIIDERVEVKEEEIIKVNVIRNESKSNNKTFENERIINIGDINENINLLRYISDELRQLMTSK